MPDSGRGSVGWKFMLPLLLLAIEAGIASFGLLLLVRC